MYILHIPCELNLFPQELSVVCHLTMKIGFVVIGGLGGLGYCECPIVIFCMIDCQGWHTVSSSFITLILHALQMHKVEWIERGSAGTNGLGGTL
jgi:hypothetical protein